MSEMMHLLVIAVCCTTCLASSADDFHVARNVRAQGEIADRLGRAYGRLTSPPLDDSEYVLSDVNFALTRRFTEYSGDISGRMLAALDDAAPLLGQRDDDFISAILEGFEQYQKPDGHFGADQHLDRQVNQQRDMPILWGNGRLLFALGRFCRHSTDGKLLKMAERLGDYLCDMRKYYGKEENFRAVGGIYASGFTTCYPSVIDGLVALAAVAGQDGPFNQKYADEARFIANLSLIDDAFAKHHSHGRLTTYRGMLDLDWLTGTNDFVDKVRDYCVKITETYQMPTGGLTELFDRDYALDEGCTEADWLWVHLLLWRATGDAAYLDAAEHILRDHLLAAQFPNGGFGHRPLRRMRDADKTLYGCGFKSFGMESYWCCSMHGAQALAQTARYAAVTCDDVVVITLLAEVSGDLHVGQRTLHITTRRISPVHWEVRVKADKPGNVKFRFRVPGWAHRVLVDGIEKASSNGWLELNRRIADEQVIKILFSTKLRQEGVYSTHVIEGEPVRLFYGPDMYCLADVAVGNGLLAKDEVPTVVFAADAPSKGIVPVVIENAAGVRQQSRLVPLASRPIGGCRCVFNVRRVNQESMNTILAGAAPMPSPGEPIVLTLLCEGEFELYLNGQAQVTGAATPAEKMFEAYGQQGENVVALRIRSKSKRPAFIGVIHAGEQVYVTDAQHWSAAKDPAAQPADWMTHAKAEMTNAVKMDDLGPWGVDPWKHVNAQYAGTGAHWIWPADDETGTWYTMRYVFTIP